MMCRAFTIIELLVSIGIFAITSALMFGALFGATEVFRRGEAARQAGDEATAVIAALQEDLSRVVPVRLRDGKPAPEWGRLYAVLSDDSGNCRISMVVENPDRSQVRWVGSGTTATVVGLRKQIEWGVDTLGTADPSDDELIREETDLGDNGNPAPGVPVRTDVITKGCLHFGVWLEVAEAHRLVKPGATGPDIGWESPQVPPYTPLPASGGNPPDDGHFDSADLITRAVGGTGFYPQPDAIRVSLVLTGGGRFATRGTLVTDISDTDTAARITGIKALPTIYGSLLRIGDEWVRYENFRNGLLTIPAVGGRGALRSTQTPHTDRPTVFAGQPFSLVVALPR